MLFSRKLFIGVVAVALFLSSFFVFAAKDPPVPPKFKPWLERDVAYIITKEEKEAFLQLPSDDARDKFIEQFWELRNPTPGAPNNPYKDEIYRRIAYADQYYGRDGWRTDRGRIYITLGRPEQVGKYLGIPNVRAMEIWFYQNSHPALPPFFYIIFYQREAGDDFRLYSPYMDGPEKLMIGSGNENDRVAAFNIIDKQAGREVARTTLSLLPNEPVDYQTATSSMASDMMLNNIRGLANHPLTKDLLQERRRLLESVSHRLVLPGEFLDVVTVSLLDSEGNTDVHYLLRVRRPEDFTVVEEKEDRYYFAASVAARVLTPDNKPIFTQERKISQYLNSAQLLQMKNKAFGYEGLLPLPPGKYKVEFFLTDDIKHTAFRQEREIVVSNPPAHGLFLSDIVPFSEASSGRYPPLPFAVANVKFTPLAVQGMTVVAGRDLKFFYQVWVPPSDPSSFDTSALDVEYAYGRMGMRDTKTITDKLSRKDFAKNGTLINGKKIPTADLPPGSYRLTVSVSDPATHERAFSSFSFAIAAGSETPASWDVNDPDAPKDIQQGTRDYQRGLCFISAGDSQQAIVSFRKALQKSPDEHIRGRLIDLLFSRQAFAEIADLYSSGGISGGTDDGTILQMAESLDKVGQMNKSIQLLESAVPLKQSSALYLTLAGYYQKIGKSDKAAEMEQKGKTIAANAPKS